jgi:hypothetical protein
VLQRDSEELAIIIPVAPKGHARLTQEQILEAQIWADVGVVGSVNAWASDSVVGPEDIWANYDPAQVKAALRQARGALTGVDRQQLVSDIYEARE